LQVVWCSVIEPMIAISIRLDINNNFVYDYNNYVYDYVYELWHSLMYFKFYVLIPNPPNVELYNFKHNKPDINIYKRLFNNIRLQMF